MAVFMKIWSWVRWVLLAAGCLLLFRVKRLQRELEATRTKLNQKTEELHIQRKRTQIALEAASEVEAARREVAAKVEAAKAMQPPKVSDPSAHPAQRLNGWLQ